MGPDRLHRLTTLNDRGTGSLCQAITDANTAGGANTINFSASLTGTITLAGDLPAIQDNGLTIDGSGASITISGNNTYRCFLIGALTPGTSTQVAESVTIANLTFSGCKAQGGAGGSGAPRAAAALDLVELSLWQTWGTSQFRTLAFPATPLLAVRGGASVSDGAFASGGGMGGNGGSQAVDTSGGATGGGLGLGANGGTDTPFAGGSSGIAIGAAGTGSDSGLGGYCYSNSGGAGGAAGEGPVTEAPICDGGGGSAETDFDFGGNGGFGGGGGGAANADAM